MVSIKIKILNPLVFIPLVLSIIGFGLITLPLDVWYVPSSLAVFYLASAIFSLTVGYSLFDFHFKIVRYEVLSIDERDVKLALRLAIVLAYVGVLLHVIDIFYYRGFDLFASFSFNRLTLMETAPTPFGVISAFFYPVAFILPFLYFLMLKTKVLSFRAVRSLLIFFPLIFEIGVSILLGARIFVFIAMFFVLFYLYMFEYIKFSFFIKKTGLALVVLFLVFFGYVFSIRAEVIGMSVGESATLSGYAYFVPMASGYGYWLDEVESISMFLFFLIVGFINLLQYLSHSIFELFFVVDNYNAFTYCAGSSTFGVVVKFLSYIGISGENTCNVLREGVYSTLWGNLFYDFGFMGIIPSFFLGALASFIMNRRFKFKWLLFPVYAHLFLIISFSLSINFISTGKGVYLLSSFFLFYTLFIIVKVLLDAHRNNS